MQRKRLSPSERPREVCLSDLADRWAAYDRATQLERDLIDDVRWLPVPETRQLLDDYFRKHVCEQCGDALHARAVEYGFRHCRTCRRQPLEAA